MKNILVLIAVALFFSCKKSKMKEETTTSFYVGTYTNGDSKGIYKYQINAQGKLKQLGLMAATVNPTFLTKSKDDKTLFAVGETNENGTGFIKSFQIKEDTLLLISKEKSGGAGPCFVAINDDNYIITANYGSGNVGLLEADAAGKLTPLLHVQQHTGKGTTDRQKAPHAHSTWFHPNKKEVISVDLGSNELWFSTIDTTKKEFVFTNQKTLKMAVGAGPRHLTFHQNNKWMYVLNELNNTISLVKEKEARYYIETSISMLPEDFKEYSKAADIHISKDGQFLYASNRGHNSIAIFQVNQENGGLKLVGFEPVKGSNPRNFAISPDNKFLLVANQDTNTIVCFKRDLETGTLTFLDEVLAPTPVCILF
ncbi:MULTISPECIES: lactonase family protein [unclassified Polaribacter]|uniref:lactonase family protein n=1 Tax=unclassified Polaribacter TaxID=196858 RepID=UPI0011BF1E88|nr:MULTISPECIES: lactonase family protein [unclassified Polaribacter]TXD54406.1 lactonase family protein [Polaribacter sp. IC063]TXD62763.1 lactonase family protein [Polaribacter sp. IC066]